MKEINRVALEEAVRCLGLPDTIERPYGDHILYFDYFDDIPQPLKVNPTVRLTFTIPLTQEIAEYLPNMKERYDIWRSILDSDRPL